MSKEKRRQKGEGSLIRLPNGNYKMTITVGKSIDGKQIRRSITASSKQEVLDRIAEIRLDKTPQQAREITFGQLYKEYEKESLRGKAPTTILSYGVMWRHLEDELANVKLSRITPQYISSLLLSMQNKIDKEKDLSPATLLLNRRLLSSIFNFAIAKEYIVKNPTHGALKGMKETKRADLQVIDEPTLKIILNDAKDHDANPAPHDCGIHWYPFILFAVSSGLRRGEIIGLRKSCIDLETGMVDVRAQVQGNQPDQPLKTKHAYRQIRVDKEVLKLVMEDSDPESDFVFANRRTHKNLAISTITSGFLSFIKRYGHKPFDNFSLHNFRHYHATKLISAGIDIKAVSRRLGHSDVMITLTRYAHWLPEADERARDIIGANLLMSANPSA